MTGGDQRRDLVPPDGFVVRKAMDHQNGNTAVLFPSEADIEADAHLLRGGPKRWPIAIQSEKNPRWSRRPCTICPLTLTG